METTSRKDVRRVVWKAVEEFTGGDVQVEFEPKDIIATVLKKDPNFNKDTVTRQIYAGCPNSGSYRYYHGNHKLYWRIGHGRYRLYDPKR